MTPTEEQRQALAVVYEMTRAERASHAVVLHSAVKNYVAAEYFDNTAPARPVTPRPDLDPAAHEGEATTPCCRQTGTERRPGAAR